MTRSPDELLHDTVRIWRAGVDAVRSDRLMGRAMRLEGETLWLGEQAFHLPAIGRIAVVGGGKAGAGMAAAVEQILGPHWMDEKQLEGWVNVPADCVCPLECIHLHGARPARVNEPRPEGVRGSREILHIVEALGPEDLCLCLISGGGSALIPSPAEGITLADKRAVTQRLSAAGATINELNTVRKQLSRIKGGGLARACCAGHLVSLIISDVLGDPLDVIASGPTVPDDSSNPAAALEVLRRFDTDNSLPPALYRYLEKKDREGAAARAAVTSEVSNIIIGNNATAVDAAGCEADRLGYAAAMTCATQSEGLADGIGADLARMALSMRDEGSPTAPDCLITGGEPVVQLAPKSQRGLGGRNQQLVLAALAQLAADGADGIALLSGGTDGEDGPTDAAGAVLNADILRAATRQGLDPADFLARNDAYHFFEPLDALIKTGPTNTNVCDLRVLVVNKRG